MDNLPTPTLGNVTALTINTPDLEKSLAYYQQLGFSLVMRSEWPFPWIQVSDGVLLMMLRKDPKPYLALTYYVKNIEELIKKVEGSGVKFEQKPKKTDTVKRALICSPDGLNISLVNIDGFSQPPGPGMLQMPQEDYFNPERYVNKTAGMFGELAHPVADLEKSIMFWEQLGFKAISKFTAPYPWAILSDGLAVVGLHQSAHFSYPAITYFAADMGTKISALKKKGLKDYKEQGPSNIVLTTPEEQHIFLFGMGREEPVEKKKIVQPTIETERLLLKELNPGIMDELFANYNDEEIKAFMGLKDADELALEKKKQELGMTTYRMSYKSFLLEEKATGKIVGRTGFHNWYAEHSRAELGYRMMDETAKNKGFMKEAVRAMIAHGFEQMGLNRIEAYVGSKNVPSLKIVKGFGFTEEGTLREHYFKNEAIEDSVCFGLLKREWKKK